MKLTRRQMVGAAVAVSAAAAKAIAQAPLDLTQQAHDNLQRNADTLAKFTLPMATEPAFQFKA